MKLDTLDALNDDDLQAVVARSRELLKEHDEERKARALSEARATLAAVGLSLKDLSARGRKAAKGLSYRGGQVYQHPTNKALTWAGKGKKPAWLVKLEGEGEKAVERA